MPQRNLGPSRRLPAALHNAASKFGGDPEQRKADRQPTLASSSRASPSCISLSEA